MQGSRKISISCVLFLAAGSLLRGQEAPQVKGLEARAATVISLNSRLIDTARPEPQIDAALRVRPEDAIEDEIVLVKFPHPATERQMKALRAASLRVYTYLPYYAYLVKMPVGAAAKASLKAMGASWSGPYQPAYKLSREIAELSAPEPPAKAVPADRRPVMIHVYPDADLVELIQKFRDVGVEEIAGAGAGSRFSRVRLLLTPGEIVALRQVLAAFRDVFWIELEGRRTLLNDTTIWVQQSGLNGGQTTPIFSQGIFGEGQVVGIVDTGIDADMCYFRDTARGLPPTNACNGGTVVNTAQRKVIAADFLWSTECAGGIASTEWDTQDHGSHVAGTVAGDNFANLLTHNPGDGMAPGAKLVIQDAGFRTDNCGDLPGIGCPVVDLNPIFQQAYTQGARIHTNSWGDNENAAVQNNYSAGSQDVDEFMWNHKDFQIFFAAGNSGPGTGSVGSPSTAKNAVSVGATQRATAANSMAGFSSCGPTADGRFKPEITMPGQNIVSANADNNTASNNCNTQALSGTSMASPGAAGAAALIRQYYTDGFYPSGTRNSANGFTPSAALVRGTMVNSAVNMTGTPVIPANCQGWGRVLLENALFFTGQTRKLWVKDNAPAFPTGSTNQDQTFTFTVTAGEALKVTLVWTDFPSTPAANPNINNDLDLIVSGPAGTFRGNVFSGGNSAAGGAADRRNTLEQVLLAAPAEGTYTVTVRSFNVPNGPQPFALVLTGNAVEGGGPQQVTVFSDDFETNQGWTVNPAGTDTATTGRWERANPEATTNGGITIQNGTTPSGVNDLVTAALAGATAGANDVDGGVTSIQSPAITLPATGTLTLSFASYFAHANNSAADDFFRVRVVGATTSTVLNIPGAATNVAGNFATTSVNISSFAGQTIRILIDVADNGTGSLVEAAVDDVRITQQ